jgi:hypothetical protein
MDILVEIICPKTQIRTLYTYIQLCDYVPLTMGEIMDEEGGFDAYICKVPGYNYCSFKNRFTDEPRLSPFKEFIDKLKEYNEYEKLFGDFHIIMTGESETAEKKRKGKGHGKGTKK